MARGKDKTISAKDIGNMSPQERAGLGNLAKMGRVKVRGSAVVRSRGSGNAKYDDPKLAGTYSEDNIK